MTFLFYFFLYVLGMCLGGMVVHSSSVFRTKEGDAFQFDMDQRVLMVLLWWISIPIWMTYKFVRFCGEVTLPE